MATSEVFLIFQMENGEPDKKVGPFVDVEAAQDFLGSDWADQLEYSFVQIV